MSKKLEVVYVDDLQLKYEVKPIIIRVDKEDLRKKFEEER